MIIAVIDEHFKAELEKLPYFHSWKGLSHEPSAARSRGVPKPFSQHHQSPSGREPQRSRQRACRAIGAVPEAGVEHRLPSEEAARPRFRLRGAPRRPHVRVPMLAPSDG